MTFQGSVLQSQLMKYIKIMLYDSILIYVSMVLGRRFGMNGMMRVLYITELLHMYAPLGLGQI